MCACSKGCVFQLVIARCGVCRPCGVCPTCLACLASEDCGSLPSPSRTSSCRHPGHLPPSESLLTRGRAPTTIRVMGHPSHASSESCAIRVMGRPSHGLSESCAIQVMGESLILFQSVWMQQDTNVSVPKGFQGVDIIQGEHAHTKPHI